ncbi:MAG: histone-like nucleoid-structuring protein Lsr2, partial [Pseudonocardiaceae bacterium]
MAQKTIVTLIDDLTGEEAEDITTVEFALEGVTYEIDLADDNAAQLRDKLSRYVAAARKTSGRRPGTRGADRPA